MHTPPPSLSPHEPMYTARRVLTITNLALTCVLIAAATQERERKEKEERDKKAEDTPGSRFGAGERRVPFELPTHTHLAERMFKLNAAI